MKKCFSFLLSFIFSLMASAVSGSCGANLTWTVEDGVLTISGTGAMTNYTRMSGYTSSAPWAWYAYYRVDISEGVASIGDYAFYRESKFTSIIIPNSVTSIGKQAFSHCRSLTSITIPNSVASIGEHAFWNCEDLTSVIIGNSVKSIGNAAFNGCSGLTSITIPNSVTSIGGGAFAHCNGLTSITIGNSVTSIGENTFYGALNISNIYSFPVNPPTCKSTNVFDDMVYKTAVLYIPIGAWADYVFDRKSDVWKKFHNVEEIDLTGIETPAISPLPAERNYYNLQGQRSAAPIRGLNIINGKKTLMH